MEASKGQMTKLKNEEEAEQIHKLQRSTAPTYNKGSMKRCHFCNKAHLFKKELYPAYGKFFNACKGKNHFAGTKFCKADVLTFSIQAKQT